MHWTEQQRLDKGGAPFLHEFSSVTSATKLPKPISKHCSARWVRSRKCSCRSTAQPTGLAGSRSSSSVTRRQYQKRFRSSTVPSLTGAIFVSVKRAIGLLVHRWEAQRSWTTAPQPWISDAVPPSPKAAGAAFGAGSADSSHATPRGTTACRLRRTGARSCSGYFTCARGATRPRCRWRLACRVTEPVSPPARPEYCIRSRFFFRP